MRRPPALAALDPDVTDVVISFCDQRCHHGLSLLSRRLVKEGPTPVGLDQDHTTRILKLILVSSTYGA
jgi:hypothetical protein